MERIKEKPPIKSRQKERTGTPVARGVSVSAQRAFRQYKESVRDAAEEGQSPEDYGGQAISDHTLSAPAQTARAGYALAKQQYARKAREKKDAEPPEEYLRNEGSEPLLSQKKTPKQPQIKEKGTYIHAQPTQYGAGPKAGGEPRSNSEGAEKRSICRHSRGEHRIRPPHSTKPCPARQIPRFSGTLSRTRMQETKHPREMFV